MENENKKGMPPARRTSKKSVAKRIVAVLIAVILIVGAVAGATLAWFTDYTDPVVNTFTVGDVQIELTETTGKEYKMVPGTVINKDPIVTVKAGSEKCYLFVELTEDLGGWATLVKPNGTNEDKWTFSELLQYSITDTDNWTKLEGVDGVYYRVVDKNEDADWQFRILKDNKITVSHLVTEEMMNVLRVGSYGNLPKLSVSAYAIQYYKTNGVHFEPLEAWKVLNPEPSVG